MKLLFVTDNGFCEHEGKYYYNAPNRDHILHLNPFFDEFEVIARINSYESSYPQTPPHVHVHLVPHYNIFQLNKLLKNLIKKCDAVICYGVNGYFASRIGRKYGKTVISYNGGDPYEFCISRGTIKGYLLAPLAKYMCKQSFKNADFGHYCDEFLFERYPASGPMLACSGVNIQTDSNVLAKRLQKIQQFSATSPIKLGLIGHTKNSLKGIDWAIKAISLLSPNYSLEIAGRGEYGDYLKQAASLGCSDRIKFLGPLTPGKDLFSWLDTLDIYIQPSRIEGLPRATIEAMSRGCPIVASNAGALNKLIDADYIFDLKCPQKLPDLIRKISVPDKMRQQSERNFEKSKQYEKSVRDQKYQNFYLKIVEKIKNKSLK